MDIIRRIDQALAITAEAYAKELEAANARLRDSLVEARAQRDYYRLWAKEMALTNAQLRGALRLMAQKVHGAHGGRGSCHWCGEPCCDDARRLLREYGEA